MTEGATRARRRLVPPLLTDRPFRRYWTGQTISLFGDEVSLVALPLTGVLVMHAGPAQMGYLMAAWLAPSLVFSLSAGAMVDRYGHRRQVMIAADLGRAALMASIPIGYAFGALTLSQLYAVAFGVGTLSVLFAALFVLYATTTLGVPPGLLGVILGAGAIGSLLGSVITGRVAARFGVGPAFTFGCLLFPAPLLLVPAAAGVRLVVLAMLFGPG